MTGDAQGDGVAAATPSPWSITLALVLVFETILAASEVIARDKNVPAELAASGAGPGWLKPPPPRRRFYGAL